MISVTILTKNSARHIKQVLQALGSFPEVVVVDTGSEDDTKQIVSQFSNVVLHERDFIGFGPTHNEAALLASFDWILSIDSDEVVSEELKEEIASIELDEDSVYSFWRKNYYRGKHIKGCGWYPDRVVRMYNRKRTRFSDDLVHESIRANGCKTRALRSSVTHYPYHCVGGFLQKMDMYSELFSQQRSGKTASMWTAISHAFFAFFKSYILQRGWLLGAEGFEISWFNMNCVFYKYLKLRERSLNKQHDSSVS